MKSRINHFHKLKKPGNPGFFKHPCAKNSFYAATQLTLIALAGAGLAIDALA
jgi:hypothetical protein